MIWADGEEYGTGRRRRRSWLERLLFCGDTYDLGPAKGTRTCDLPARHVGTHSDGRHEWGTP